MMVGNINQDSGMGITVENRDDGSCTCMTVRQSSWLFVIFVLSWLQSSLYTVLRPITTHPKYKPHCGKTTHSLPLPPLPDCHIYISTFVFLFARVESYHYTSSYHSLLLWKCPLKTTSAYICRYLLSTKSEDICLKGTEASHDTRVYEMHHPGANTASRHKRIHDQGVMTDFFWYSQPER